MPSMRWAGVRWHLSSDALALAGGVLLVVNAAWLAAYAAIVASLGRPQPCDARGEHRAVVWGLLGFLALNVVAAAAMVWVGTRGALQGCGVHTGQVAISGCHATGAAAIGGPCSQEQRPPVQLSLPAPPYPCAGTPLQPSRRRWMGPLMYFQAAKWLASVGYIAFCFQAVYTLPNACWQDERRGLIQGMLWSTTAIFAVLGWGAACCFPAPDGRLLAAYALTAGSRLCDA